MEHSANGESIKEKGTSLGAIDGGGDIVTWGLLASTGPLRSLIHLIYQKSHEY
ncbi:hypothetical protein AAAC51_30380 [Priestia megaterium]